MNQSMMYGGMGGSMGGSMGGGDDGQGTSISQLPTQQQLPDYNNMYKNTSNPLAGASSPGQSQASLMDNGPMAANEAFGGMFGGTTF